MRDGDKRSHPEAPPWLCPHCGIEGKEVKPVTVLSLLTDDARARLSRDDGLRLCPTPACDVSYYHPETRELFGLEDVRVSIGQKQGGSPHTICYCFNHTAEDIEAEVAREGTSRIPDAIREKCAQGQNRCEESNPQGSCCLGDVNRAVEEAQAKYPVSAPAGRLPVEAAAGEAACCAADAPPEKTPAAAMENRGTWAMGGAVVAAALSSACCWGPLILIATGASAAGISGLLEAYRPYLLGVTGLLLASGFYMAYFRKEKCATQGACEARSPRLRRFNKITVWMAAVAVSLFVLFPNYSVYMLGGSDLGAATEIATAEGRPYRIEGMTCEACARRIEMNLIKVPGVSRADVSYETGIGRIFFTPGATPPSDAMIRTTIESAGYQGFPADTEKGESVTTGADLERIGKAVAYMLRGAVDPRTPQLPGVLLRLVAEGRPVSPERIAANLDIPLDELASALRSSTAIELDGDGNVVAAFGLSLSPTPHHFEVNGNKLYTWCALDTLYIPAAIEQTGRVESTCPITGETVRLKVTPDGVESLEPGGAVVAIAIQQNPEACHSIRDAFCDHVYFLSSREAASEWSAGRQKTIVLSVEDAHKVGRIMVEHIFEASSNAQEGQA